MKKYILAALILIPFLNFSQLTVEGVVKQRNGNNSIALPGANVYWMDSQTGTITNDEGFFSIPYLQEYDKLIISYVGFTTDTLTINEPQKVNRFLNPSNELDEVVVQQ